MIDGFIFSDLSDLSLISGNRKGALSLLCLSSLKELIFFESQSE